VTHHDLQVVYATKGPNAGWDFIQHISPCIDVLRHVIQTVEEQFQLHHRTGIHKSPKIDEDIRKLRSHLEEARIHVYTKGRNSEMDDVVDTLFRGMQVVQGNNGKLRQFEQRLSAGHEPQQMDDHLDDAADASLPNLAFDAETDIFDADLFEEFAECVFGNDDESDATEEENNGGGNNGLLL
jgi:hypothetical protein